MEISVDGSLNPYLGHGDHYTTMMVISQYMWLSHFKILNILSMWVHRCGHGYPHGRMRDQNRPYIMESVDNHPEM